MQDMRDIYIYIYLGGDISASRTTYEAYMDGGRDKQSKRSNTTAATAAEDPQQTRLLLKNISTV